MFDKKAVFLQSCIFGILGTIFYLLPSAEFPFLKKLFTYPVEIYYILQISFAVLILSLSVALGALWHPGIRRILTVIFPVAGWILCALTYFKCIENKDSYIFFLALGAFTAGRLEKKYNIQNNFYCFLLLLPLPFLFFLTAGSFDAAAFVLPIWTLLGIFCIAVNVFILSDWKKYFVKICFFLFTCGALLIYMIPGLPEKFRCDPGQDHLSAERKTYSFERNNTLFPLLVLALLQSDQPDQKILILSERKKPEILLDTERSLPFRRKKIMPLRSVYSADLIQDAELVGHEDFDVILLDLPQPVNLLDAGFYTEKYFRTLAERMSRGTVLAIELPTDMKNDFLLTQILPSLRKYFSLVKVICAGRWILCSDGRKNFLTDPDLLEHRAEKLIRDREYLPSGVFHILLGENAFSHNAVSDGQKYIQKTPSPVDILLHSNISFGRYISRIHRRLQCYVVKIPCSGLILTCLILSVIISFRYFLSTGKRRMSFIASDNGFYLGTLSIFPLIKTVWDSSGIIYDLSAVFFLFCGIFCGALLYNYSKNKWLIRGITAAGLILLAGCLYFPDKEIIFPAALFAGGTDIGIWGRLLENCRKEHYAGIALGLFAGCLEIILPEALSFLLLLAVCRIPVLTAENIEKEFEKM